MFHMHENSEEWYISPAELDEIIRYHCGLPAECNLEYKMDEGKIEISAWIKHSSGENIRITPGDIDGKDNDEGTTTESDPPGCRPK